ncbi:MAG: dihydrodipicolinate synthase family protein [Bryobacteraceae bacterium]
MVAPAKVNNQYDTLTHVEVRQLTRVVVEAVKDRALVIAAAGSRWTGQAIDLARYATSVGAA